MTPQHNTPLTPQRQRPWLVGGAALAIALWIFDVLNHAFGEWGILALLVGAAGYGVWWLQKTSARSPATQPIRVDSTLVKRALADAEQVITQLQTEVDEPDAPPIGAIAKPKIPQLQSQMSQIATDLQRDILRVSIVGGKSSGKSTLMQRLQADWATGRSLTLHEATSFTGTAPELTAAQIIQQAIAADLILFLITGDLTESELQTVKQFAARKRTLLVLNKQDQYLPDERQLVLNRIQARLSNVLPVSDVVAIAAAPKPLKVRQHQDDGAVKEWLEDQAPAITPLTERLEYIVQHDRQQLVLASTFSDAMALKSQAKTVLNDVRRARALPVVEQFQWIAAATAFASPMPTVDLVATAAISVQMVHDLGAIYRQKFSLSQAQKIATTLASLMLKQGFVELSTQAIASLLKTNLVTYIAGGCVQGISAAYLTRVAGLSLIEYFHTQDPNLTMIEASPLAIERFSQILQSVFQKNQQVAFLQTFVGQAIDRFMPRDLQSPQLAAAGTAAIDLSQMPKTDNLAQNGASVSVPSLDSTVF